MRKFIDRLAIVVARKPRAAAIALLVGYAWAALAGLAFLVK